MPWDSGVEALKQVQNLSGLVDVLSGQLSKLAQVVKCYERVAALPYGPLIQVPGELTRVCYLRVTNNSNFTIQNPTRPREGVQLTLDIHNDSAGAMGTITWGSEYNFATAWVNPGAGARTIVTFYRSL